MNVREMTDEGLAGAIMAGLVAEPIDQGRMDELQAETRRRHREATSGFRYRIEYSGGCGDQTWHGEIIVDARDAAEALNKSRSDLEAISAHIDAINPVEE